MEVRTASDRMHESCGHSCFRQVVLVANLIDRPRAEDRKQCRVDGPKVHEENLGVGIFLAQISHGKLYRSIGGGQSIHVFLEYEKVAGKPAPFLRHGLAAVLVLV